MTTPEEVIHRVRTVSTAVRRREGRITIEGILRYRERRLPREERTPLYSELSPEQRILRRFVEGTDLQINVCYENVTERGFGIMKYKIMNDFLNLYEEIEKENDPIRKGKWIIAREQTIQLCMKFWKGTKQEDELSSEIEPQLKEIKHQLRLNYINRQRILRRIHIPNEEECSLFEEINLYFQQEITENEEENLATEYLMELFQEWNQ